MSDTKQHSSFFSSFKIMFAMKNIDWIGISCRYKEMNVSLLEKKSPRLILPIFPICSFQIVSRTFHIAQSYKTIGTLVYVIYVDHPVSKSVSVKYAARITVLVEINWKLNLQTWKSISRRHFCRLIMVGPFMHWSPVSPLLYVSLIMIAINLLMSVLTWLILW